jgi:hypothetical protein
LFAQATVDSNRGDLRMPKRQLPLMTLSLGAQADPALQTYGNQLSRCFGNDLKWHHGVVEIEGAARCKPDNAVIKITLTGRVGLKPTLRGHVARRIVLIEPQFGKYSVAPGRNS